MRIFKVIIIFLCLFSLLSVFVFASDLPEGYDWFVFISGEKQKDYMESHYNSICSYTYTLSDGSVDADSVLLNSFLDRSYNYPVVHWNKGLVLGRSLDSVSLSMFTVSNRFSYVDKLYFDFYVSGYGYTPSATLCIMSVSGFRRYVTLEKVGDTEGYDPDGNYTYVFVSRFSGIVDIDPASDDYLLSLIIEPFSGLPHVVTQNDIDSSHYWVQFNDIYYTPSAGYNGNVIQIIQGQQDILNGIDQASDDIQNSIESSADRIDQSIQDAADQIQSSIDSGVADIIDMPGVDFVPPEGVEDEEYVLSEFDSLISGFSHTDLSWMDMTFSTFLIQSLRFVGASLLVPIFSSTPVKQLFISILPVMLFLLAVGALSSIGSSLSHRSSLRSYHDRKGG